MPRPRDWIEDQIKIRDWIKQVDDALTYRTHEVHRLPVLERVDRDVVVAQTLDWDEEFTLLINESRITTDPVRAEAILGRAQQCLNEMLRVADESHWVKDNSLAQVYSEALELLAWECARHGHIDHAWTLMDESMLAAGFDHGGIKSLTERKPYKRKPHRAAHYTTFVEINEPFASQRFVIRQCRVLSGKLADSSPATPHQQLIAAVIIGRYRPRFAEFGIDPTVQQRISDAAQTLANRVMASSRSTDRDVRAAARILFPDDDEQAFGYPPGSLSGLWAAHEARELLALRPAVTEPLYIAEAANRVADALDRHLLRDGRSYAMIAAQHFVDVGASFEIGVLKALPAALCTELEKGGVSRFSSADAKALGAAIAALPERDQVAAGLLAETFLAADGAIAAAQGAYGVATTPADRAGAMLDIGRYSTIKSAALSGLAQDLHALAPDMREGLRRAALSYMQEAQLSYESVQHQAQSSEVAQVAAQGIAYCEAGLRRLDPNGIGI